MSSFPKSDEAKVRIRWKYKCKFCGKALTKKEIELHFYVCEKVSQEIFNDNYFNTLLGGSSVSFGTTSNSSLTNPLLGGRLVVPPPPSLK